MEQRSRKPPHGEAATGETASIPSPRQPSAEALPAVDPLPDDEVDSDTPVTGSPAEARADESLAEREREILAFERQSWRHAGAKEQAIRDRFQLSATRYYQLLNALLDSPAALAHDPVLVGRLRRLRGSRARARGR